MGGEDPTANGATSRLDEEARGMVNPGAAPRRGPAVVLCRELRDSATGNLVRGAPAVAVLERDYRARQTVVEGDARYSAAADVSRRFILGFLAIQRVDGPSLAMLTHPSNQSNSQGMTRPSPLPCRAGYLAGVFFATPRRVPVRAATRITRLRGPPWHGHSGMTPRSGGAAGSRIP